MVSFSGSGCIHCVFSPAAGNRVVETDGVGMDFPEYGFKQACERLFRGIIRPQGKYPARGQMSGQFRQAFGGIKPGVVRCRSRLGVWSMSRRMMSCFFPGKSGSNPWSAFRVRAKNRHGPSDIGDRSTAGFPGEPGGLCAKEAPVPDTPPPLERWSWNPLKRQQRYGPAPGLPPPRPDHFWSPWPS